LSFEDKKGAFPVKMKNRYHVFGLMGNEAVKTEEAAKDCRIFGNKRESIKAAKAMVAQFPIVRVMDYCPDSPDPTVYAKCIWKND
jgi:hypothetical protein